MDLLNIKTKEDIRNMLIEQKYLPSKEIIYTLFNAIKLDMPILI